MAKRFIDTGFLDQKWIRKLPPEKKIFLIYLMLKCDNGGIIDLDMDDVQFWIGKKISNLDFLPENYLIPLNNSDKYFMPKFIGWQYKDLSSQKFIVVQARQILEKHNLINADFTLKLDKIYVKVTKNVPESQEQGKGKGIGKGIGIKSINVSFEKFWNLYDKKRGDKSKLSKKWESFSDEIRLEIMAYLPKYIQSTPDKSFRKDPQTFFNNHSWEDEIIVSAPVRTTPILTYEEILKLSEKNPEIWKQYKAVKRDGERKAVFELIT
jgi:hypothetical protein